MNQLHCYGTRLLNPYLGTLQVANADFVRALSRDGYQWEIQVHVERQVGGWGSLNRQQKALSYYRYAFWNPSQGLRRMPTDPSLDQDQLEAAADLIANQLSSGLLQQLPFPLQDHYELWLLDKQQMPLALLGSTADADLIPGIREQRWQALSSALAIAAYPHSRVEPLERLIRVSAGHRQWFQRRNNGAGVGMQALCPSDLVGRELSPSSFPELLVRAHWNNPLEQQLVDEWTGYLAPWLLQLPGVSEQTRGQLERDACRNPRRVEALHRLYPRVIDRQLLNTTRVAAKIEMANG